MFSQEHFDFTNSELTSNLTDENNFSIITEIESNAFKFSTEINNSSIQDSVIDPMDEIVDLGDLIKLLFKKKDSVKNKPPKKRKKIVILVLPNISYNPITGVLVGGSFTGAGKLGDGKTRISLVTATAAVTTEEQFISFVKSSIYTNNNEFFLEGDWRYYKYSAPTFGLGTSSPDRDLDNQFSFQGTPVEEGNGEYSMKYNYAIFKQVVSKKIVENVYFGIGYELDSYWNIEDLELNLDTIPAQLTPHYTHSIENGFNPTKYKISGLSLNVTYDSRDNQINAYKGIFAKINYRYNSKYTGSTKSSSELWLEFRTYVGLSKKTERNLLAFWAFGNFQTSGTLPYLTLMSTAGDKKARSGRGYIAGRYRGESMLYGEIEYRFPIMPRKQTIGGVIFLNGVTTTNYATGEKLFDYVKPAIGFGLRLLVNKHTRLNVNLDLGIGVKSSGAYFSAGETY